MKTTKIKEVVTSSSSNFDPLAPSYFLIKILSLCGLWPNVSNKSCFSLYTLYTCVFQIFFTFMYTGFKCINFIYLDNLNEITRAMFICLTELALIVKIINFYYHIKEMKNCLNNVKEFVLINEMEINSFQEKLSLFMRIVIWYMAVANIAGIFSYLSPFFSDTPILPYPAWYPLNWQNDLLSYWIVYVYQVIGMFIQTHCLITIEMYAIFLMLTAGTYLEMLGKRLQNIGYDMNMDLAIDERSTMATATLIDCINWHTRVIKYI